jgi:hypothetical protein
VKYCTQCGAEAEEREFAIPASFDVDTGKQNTRPLLICSRNPCHMGHHNWRRLGLWKSWLKQSPRVCDICGEKDEFLGYGG